MRYFKVVNDGRILGVGTTTASEIPNEITEEEFAELSKLLTGCPSTDYALMADTLTWEQYEHTLEEELADTEALAILSGGGV